MPTLTFALTFSGQAAPVGENPTRLKAMSKAESCRKSATIGPNGVEATHEAIVGGDASFTSEVVFSSETEFDEFGTIDYDHGNRLHFTTVGIGHIGPSAVEGVQTGAVVWKIDRGEGAFAGATGYITSNFAVDADGTITDHQLANLVLP